MSAGTRDFSETIYANVFPEVATKNLIRRGYRQVSNAFRELARVDITEDELKNFLKKAYHWPDASRYTSDPRGWQDHYRRCHTKDVIKDVPEEIMGMMRNLIDYRLNCFERRPQMLRLKDLAAGETFKHPGGIHTFQVTDEREESCGNLRIFIKNLTSGRSYFQGGYRTVIRVPHPGDKRRFWMCYVDGQGVPTHQHFTLQEAQTEAERLARKTGKNVFVLQAFKFVTVSSPVPPLTWHTTDGS